MLDPRDRDLIIRTVIGEAANQPAMGQAAVAHVIRNRVNAGGYGNGVQDVLFAPKQFEPWNTRRDELMAYAPEDPRYQRAASIVDGVFGDKIPDITKGATHFANVDTVRQRGNNAALGWIGEMQKNGSSVRIGAHTFGAPDSAPGRRAKPAFPDDLELVEDAPAPAQKQSAIPDDLELLEDAPAASPAQQNFNDRFGDGPMASQNPIAARELGVSDIITGKATGLSPLQEGLQRFAEANDPRFRGQQQARREGEFFDAIPRAITTGTLGNLPDYGPAFVEGVKGIFDGRGYSNALNEELEVQRGQREGLEEKFPLTTIAGNLTGAIAPAVATAGLASGPNLVVRGGKAAVIGGALGGAQGFAQGEGFEDRKNQAITGAKWGAALGPVGEVITTGAGAAVGKVFGGARNPAPGVNPEQIVQEAAEFGIPLSRGQALSDIGQQAWEESARNNARGDIAGRAVRSFDERQAQAIQAAKESITEGFGGNAPATLAEGGEAVALGLRNKADELRQGADAAYTAAAGKDATIAIDEVGRLGQKVAVQLEEQGINLDTYGNYPGAQSAMNLLRRVAGFEGAPAGENVVAQSLQGLEQARKALLKVKPANGEDYRALKAIRSAYDSWMDDAIDQKLFSGDASALDDLKKGRELWSQYKGLTAGKGGDALPILGKMIEEGRTGEEIANWLMGASTAGQAGRAARVAFEVKKVLGADSQEWQTLRQMAVMKAFNPTRGTGNQALFKSVGEFTKSPLSRQLFSPEEIGQLRRFAATVGRTVTDPRATNRGQSGYEIGRMLNSILPQLGLGAAGAGGAYATGDNRFLALAAVPLFKNVSAASKGLAATKALPSKVGPKAAELTRALTFSVSPAMGLQSR
jgi:hypothetical protein